MDFVKFVGGWLLVAIQTWVAQRWSSFTVASTVGIALTIVGVVGYGTAGCVVAT